MFDWVWSPYSILTWMYDYPREWALGIKKVFEIQENWHSILITVLFVCLIFALLLNFNRDKE